jgi:hypothetical protein
VNPTTPSEPFEELLVPVACNRVFIGFYAAPLFGSELT